MAMARMVRQICAVLALLSVSLVTADDPYRFYTWTVTYGTISPLGVPQQVLDCMTLSLCFVVFEVNKLVEELSSSPLFFF